MFEKEMLNVEQIRKLSVSLSFLIPQKLNHKKKTMAI